MKSIIAGATYPNGHNLRHEVGVGDGALDALRSFGRMSGWYAGPVKIYLPVRGQIGRESRCQTPA
jgi:hypothetical protein